MKTSKIIRKGLIALMASVVFISCKQTSTADSRQENSSHVPGKQEVSQMLIKHYGKAANGMDWVYNLELHKHGDYIYSGNIELLGKSAKRIVVYVDEDAPHDIRWDFP